MKKLLYNGLVLTMEANWQPELLDIAIDDQTITHLGLLDAQQREQYRKDGYELFDMSGKVLLPGFINTHGHAAMTLLRSYADDLPLQVWLEEKIWPFEAQMTDDDIYWGTKLAIVEMLESGTTCFTDMYASMQHVAQAADELGIRACLSRGLIGFAANRDQALQESEELIRTWHGQANGRITCTLGPHAPYTCPPEYLERVIRMSEELDVPMQIHVAETRKEVEDCIAQYGVTPVQHLQNVGIFKRPVIAAHCVHLNEQDIDIMHRHNVRISHNPGSNLKLGSGIAPVPAYIEKGITVGIGTDGCSSNNNLNMLEELQLTAIIHKGAAENPTVIPARKALELATIEGAKVLSLENVTGSLKVGKQADIIAFDMEQPHFYPQNDIVSLLVYSANAHDISDVFVAGKQVVKQGKVDIDRQTLFQKAQAISNRISKDLQ